MSDYLQYFDPDALLDPNEYTLSFTDFDNMDWIGQEEQNIAPNVDPFDFGDFDMPLIGQEGQNNALDFGSSLLPDATAAPVEPTIQHHPISLPGVANIIQTSPAFSQPHVQPAQPPSITGTTRMNTTSLAESLLAQPCHLTATPEVHVDRKAHPDNHGHGSDVSSHYRVQGPSRFSCAECHSSFPTRGDLRIHANDQRHSQIICACGEKFSRTDVLSRHVASFRKATKKFPCTFCKRHRGNQGFRRQDHLVQHLLGYHKFETEEVQKICPTSFKTKSYYILVCPDPQCEFYRGDEYWRLGWSNRNAQSPFKKQSDYSKHLKDVHEISRFPCPVAGCDRVDAKGYMAANGLMKHLACQHPGEPQRLEDFRERLGMGSYNCNRCNKRIYDLGEFNLHRRLAHQH
ncbi:hypothetical protein F4677DRAFT_440532 [Hypoxylon crocopeplum]|nr:hypothetical protein F4677DRAFT_440532 [Hypoxylon crocopeplum]